MGTAHLSGHVGPSTTPALPQDPERGGWSVLSGGQRHGRGHRAMGRARGVGRCGHVGRADAASGSPPPCSLACRAIPVREDTVGSTGLLPRLWVPFAESDVRPGDRARGQRRVGCRAFCTAGCGRPHVGTRGPRPFLSQLHCDLVKAYSLSCGQGAPKVCPPQGPLMLPRRFHSAGFGRWTLTVLITRSQDLPTPGVETPQAGTAGRLCSGSRFIFPHNYV